MIVSTEKLACRDLNFAGSVGFLACGSRPEGWGPYEGTQVFKEPSPIHEASTQADGGTRRFGKRRL